MELKYKLYASQCPTEGRSCLVLMIKYSGRVAQLVARVLSMHKVAGSIPASSRYTFWCFLSGSWLGMVVGFWIPAYLFSFWCSLSLCFLHRNDMLLPSSFASAAHVPLSISLLKHWFTFVTKLAGDGQSDHQQRPTDRPCGDGTNFLFGSSKKKQEVGSRQWWRCRETGRDPSFACSSLFLHYVLFWQFHP